MTNLTVETDSGNFAQNITILLVFIILGIFGVVLLVIQNNKQFGQWFQKVLENAHQHGCTQEEIQKFEEIFWWDYYCLDMTPDEAIKHYKKDN